MKAGLFSAPKVLDRYAAEWGKLMTHSAANHLFLTPTFQKIWWRHFGEGQRQILTLHNDHQNLVALAPLMLKEQTLSLVGGEEVADYLDVVVAREKEEENYRHLWQALLNLNWRHLRLTSLPAASPTLNYFPALAKGADLKVEKKIKKPVCYLELPESWEKYLENLPRKARHELQRKLRRINRAGTLKTYRTTQTASLPNDLDIFFRLHRTSRAAKSEFMDEKMERFFREVAAVFFKEDRLVLEFLLLNEQPIAAKFAFLWQNNLLLYNSGFDPAFSHDTPGLILTALCLRESIEKGLKNFDFMQGRERYKRDFGGQEDFVYNIDIVR